MVQRNNFLPSSFSGPLKSYFVTVEFCFGDTQSYGVRVEISFSKWYIEEQSMNNGIAVRVH